MPRDAYCIAHRASDLETHVALVLSKHGNRWLVVLEHWSVVPSDIHAKGLKGGNL
jgi:hypothetical protein